MGFFSLLGIFEYLWMGIFLWVVDVVLLCGRMINELHRCESGGKKKKNPIHFHSSCSVSARSPAVYTKQLQFLGYSMLKCAQFNKNKISKKKKKKPSYFPILWSRWRTFPGHTVGPQWKLVIINIHHGGSCCLEAYLFLLTSRGLQVICHPT